MTAVLSKIQALAASSGGFFSNAMAFTAGINRVTLKRYCDKGIIERVSPGRYALPDQMVDEYELLQSKIKDGIFSFETALFFWDMTDRVPHIIEMTVPIGSNTTAFRQRNPNVQFHYVPLETFSLGRTETKSPQGGTIILYDKERCLCDIIRNRRKTDMQVYTQAIKTYFSNKPNVRKLIKDSRIFGVEKKIRPYLEVLL